MLDISSDLAREANMALTKTRIPSSVPLHFHHQYNPCLHFAPCPGMSSIRARLSPSPFHVHQEGIV